MVHRSPARRRESGDRPLILRKHQDDSAKLRDMQKLGSKSRARAIQGYTMPICVTLRSVHVSFVRTV